MSQIPDTRPGFYYVTVRREGRKGFEHVKLRGPFSDHASALAAVDEATRRAYELDPRAPWYAYGTARTEEELGPGLVDTLKKEKAA